MAGSSPRVWGQVIAEIADTVSDGIIPTRMGTSYIWHCINNGKQDHPHAYGDKRVGIFEQGAYQGSSPRVWGQVEF